MAAAADTFNQDGADAGTVTAENTINVGINTANMKPVLP